jgi:hypothetical protein
MRRSYLTAALILGLSSSCANSAPATPEPTPLIVVDQFGYLPDQPKVAVLRDPVVGYDAAQSYEPGSEIQVVDASDGHIVLRGRAVPWGEGKVDPTSGDRAWWFDFSPLRSPGRFRIVDPAKHVQSAPFAIGPDVYRPVLVQAVRMLFYQRAGFPKDARYAGAKWADGASHQGPLQDLHARYYATPGDAASERDLHGGWFDAGDFNRYAPWAGQNIVVLLNAFRERPGIWGDDYNIPESGDGIPDLLNEVKWELDWLVRMQNPDGSMLALVASAPGSPPSAAQGQSLYGASSSFATSSAASAFALGAKVYGQYPRYASYARDLAVRAEKAWDWVQDHPDVVFHVSSADNGKVRLAGDAIEIDGPRRSADRVAAAAYLYELTRQSRYRDYVDAHLGDVGDRDYRAATALLAYAAAPGATAGTIVASFRHSVDQLRAAASDPYRAYLIGYWWGSNETKSEFGLRYAQAGDLAQAADYIHYIHGVNPLGKVYLSNMAAFGATNSVDRFFHSWFADGTRWSSVSSSPNGPPPGYLVGGPDSTYNWEKACPQLNPKCGAAPPSPPKGQPPQKSYADFNTGWPIDSWQVTEPDLLYQTAYIRLLSKFVR